VPDRGSSDPSYQLNARLLRYRSRPGSEEPVALIEDLVAAGRLGDARGVAVVEQTEHPEDVRFVLLEGQAWLQERDLARAQAVLLRGIKVDPQSADAYRWLGEVLLERGDAERSLKAVQRGLAIAAHDTELLRLKARATRAVEAASPGGFVIDVPSAPSATSESREPTKPLAPSRPTASPPARARAVTPQEIPKPPPAPVIAPPAPVIAPPAPVIAPPPAVIAPPPAVAPPQPPAVRERSLSPSLSRPLPAHDSAPRDNTLQGLFGPGAAGATGGPIGERRSGGTLPLPSRAPMPPPNAPPAPRKPIEPPVRHNLGESLERVEISPRAQEPRTSIVDSTVPGLLDAPISARAPVAPPPTKPLSWDDDVDDVPTGNHDAPLDEPVLSVPDADAAPGLMRVADELPRGPVPQAEPDVQLGSDAGGAEDVDAMLDMLRRQGIFEPPTGTVTAWADRKSLPRSGNKVTTVLIAVWVAAVLLAGGGYFGWQQYVALKHGEALALTKTAMAEIATGEYQALVNADRNLRLAHAAHPMSARVVQAMLLLHSVRALEDGTGDASALRTTLAGATNIASQLTKMGAVTTVSSAYMAAATATSSALNGEIAATRTAITEALATAGNDLTLRYWLARTAQRIGEPGAMADLTAVVEADQTLLAAALAVAELEREAGLIEEALARVQKVLQQRPTHLRARLWRAHLTADQEAPAEALVALDLIAKELDRAAPADRVLEAVTRARLLRRSGKVDLAGDRVAAALQLGATDPRLVALVAEEARRGGRLGVAQMAATQAVNGAPAVAAYRRLLAEVLIDRQDGGRALTILEQLSSDDPDVLAMRAQAALLLGTRDALSQVGVALDAYVTSNETASVRVKALRLRVRAQVDVTPAVLKDAEKLSKEAPGDPDALLALGEAALALREGAIADRALTALIKVAPETVRAYYLLGRVKRLNGDADAAEANLRKTLELAPSHTEALIALGSLLLDRAKYADADLLYQELATRSGESHYGRLGRVEALIGLGQLDDAQVQWEGVAERHRDSAAARQTGARLALARTKPGEALTLLQPLTQGEARQASVMALYGDALYAADQVDAAAGAYDAALELDEGLPEALIGRGEVEVRAEKPDEALEHLVGADAALKARIRPPELAARMWLLTGRAYLQRNKRGDMEAAREALTNATAIATVDSTAFFWLGESWAGKNTPEARAAYERYMELSPDGEFGARARKALSVR